MKKIISLIQYVIWPNITPMNHPHRNTGGSRPMARTPRAPGPAAEASNDIYHELEEDIRQQKLRAFWQENGSWIIGGVIAAVIMTGGISFWRDHEAKVHLRETTALLAAVESADPAKIEAAGKGAGKAHEMLSLFAEARLFAERGEQDKAAAVYEKISGMTRVDGAWRDLAALYGVMAKIDTGESVKLHETLKGLEAKNAPWRWSALELDGLLLAREKKNAEASALFATLADAPEAPSDIRVRAASMRDLYAQGGKP
jgi:hypothetical protein